MGEHGIITAQEERNKELLEAGLATADCYISRNYLIDLSKKEVVPVDEELCRDTSLRFYHIERFVYDKKENVNDKMISVYSALHELNGTAILLIHGDKAGISYHLGVRSDDKAALCGDVLSKSLSGNFPGSSIKLKKTSQMTGLLDTFICDSDEHKKNVSAVSVVPSMRDEDKDKFVQGIEKFIETMQGEEYTALFIAAPINKTDLEYRKRGLEELASALSPFSKTTLAYGENSSKAVTEGMCENFSRSVNQSIANTTGYNQSSNKSFTQGSSKGMGLGGMNTGRNKSRTSGYSSGTNWSRAVTEGTADTTGSSTNTSDTITTGDNRTMTVEHINKSVENILKTIDDQLKRIKDCESFGLWDCAAYFLSDQIQVSVMAANTYKALVSGDTSSVENAYINVWGLDNPYRNGIIDALRYGLHPNILVSEGARNGFDSQIVTPGGFASGKELPLFMGVPQKSVSGLTVSAIAEFGRGVFTLDNQTQDGDLPLGHIFHMGKQEEATVSLDSNSFTSHCFIAGSTGSGKSNTSYVLLNEFYKRNIPFLVIEPAKGEYKSEFGSLPDIHIYSTNPRYGQMLRINPFWFDSEEIHVLEHLDRLIEIFNACWEMYAAMPAILKAAAERIYVQKGWDLLNSVYIGPGEPEFPTFADLLAVLPEVIKTSGYSSDTQGDYTGALVTRVASLANGISGQIFCSGFAIPDNVLFDENTIIDLSRVGSTETKALIMGLLVMKLTEYRTAQATGSNSKLRHVTILEEAHNLLKRTGTAQGQDTANLVGKSVEMISNSIAEMRTYGEGFIIIDQSPTAVDISAIKNTNTKIIMRLPEKADCEAVGNAMALNEEQVKELAKLPTGVAAVIQNNWLEAALVKINRAPNVFQKELKPVDAKVLAQLRGLVVSLLVRQFFDDRCFNCEEIKEKVLAFNAPEQKKKEILDSAFALIDKLGTDRNVKIISQNLMDMACCKGVFDICSEQLTRVDLNAQKEADYELLRKWRDNITNAISDTVVIESNLTALFTRLMIFNMIQSAEREKYHTIYKMLYYSNTEKPAVTIESPSPTIEAKEQEGGIR